MGFNSQPSTDQVKRKLSAMGEGTENTDGVKWLQALFLPHVSFSIMYLVEKLWVENSWT